MAKVYKTVDGEQLERLIARTGEVQRRLHLGAEAGAAKAEGILNTSSKHRTGHSQINIEEADIDWHVYLEDEYAASIEFGRDGYRRRNRNGEEVYIDPVRTPIAPLRRAFGLEVTAHYDRYADFGE